MNKAAPANAAAIAFKTGFSARALFGLLGDDDFRVKLSPDGSTYAAWFWVGNDTPDQIAAAPQGARRERPSEPMPLDLAAE